MRLVGHEVQPALTGCRCLNGSGNRAAPTAEVHRSQAEPPTRESSYADARLADRMENVFHEALNVGQRDVRNPDGGFDPDLPHMGVPSCFHGFDSSTERPRESGPA